MLAILLLPRGVLILEHTSVVLDLWLEVYDLKTRAPIPCLRVCVWKGRLHYTAFYSRQTDRQTDRHQ
jgi:hypothetical protein